MQALAASCEELRARTGNPPLGSETIQQMSLSTDRSIREYITVVG
jgi:hypothetical protein